MCLDSIFGWEAEMGSRLSSQRSEEAEADSVVLQEDLSGARAQICMK